MEKEIETFSHSTTFTNLEIQEATWHDNLGWVSFQATLFQNGKETSFAEKSTFVKEKEAWLYYLGEKI